MRISNLPGTGWISPHTSHINHPISGCSKPIVSESHPHTPGRNNPDVSPTVYEGIPFFVLKGEVWGIFPGYMDVSENSGTPESSILVGFSIKNHPFWGTQIFGNTYMGKIIEIGLLPRFVPGDRRNKGGWRSGSGSRGWFFVGALFFFVCWFQMGILERMFFVEFDLSILESFM